MTTTEDDLKDELLRALNAELDPQPDPDEFSIAQYAAAQIPPMTRDKAKGILERGRAAGKVTQRVIKATAYYRKAE
jgi:hypothetical protein